DEVIRFFRELLEKDLSVENVIDSDFVMINNRLAEHYGLPTVEGTNIRRVALPKESVRGGVLGMAAIHKVTANGASTSPVVRGVWVLERVMGIHPPPPPTSVPAIEPDIRGTKTVLDQLEKHRESSSCTSCHQLIDPPGVALEVFDVIGQLRQNYRQYKPGKESEKVRPKAGKLLPIFYEKGLPVVAGYTMKDGEKFKNFNEFKALLLRNPDKIAKNVAEKLVTYATGSGISVSDRSDIDKIVAEVKTKDYGFRSLIHEVVKSQIFQRK
ncbi:MAG: DUF1588 domain-containing protein, partial [Lentisphaeraceae bacterium]|nr:DUF1588 domain-containing protein [Lentisphaeraceae bacterium]